MRSVSEAMENIADEKVRAMSSFFTVHACRRPRRMHTLPFIRTLSIKCPRCIVCAGTVPCVGAAYKALFQVISSVEASNVLSDSFMLYHVCDIQGQLPAPFDGVHVNNVAPVLTSPCRVVEGVQLVDIAGCSQVVSPQSNYRTNGINASDVSVASGMCLVAQLPAVEPSSTSDRVMKDQPLCASAVDTVITRTRCGIANWTKTLCGSACSHRVDSTEPKATEHLVFAMQRTSLYSGKFSHRFLLRLVVCVPCYQMLTLLASCRYRANFWRRGR